MSADVDPRPIRVILPWTAHALCAQHLLIEPLGIAEEEGLSVSVDFTVSPLDASNGVAEGRYDVTEVNSVFAFQLHEQDLPIKPFYSICRAAYRSFAVPVDSPIQTLSQLRGVTVGTDHPDLLGLAGPVLRSEGVDLEEIDWATDFMWDSIPTENDLERLRDGTLQGIWLLACEFEMLCAEGIPLRRLPAPALTALTPGACLYARRDALADERRDALVAYARAIARTTAFCQEDPERAVQLVWDYDPRTRPDGDEERALRRDAAAIRGRNLVCQLSHGDEPVWGAVSEREIKHWESFLLDNGVVKTRRPAEAYFDFDLAAEAAAAS